MKKIKLHRWSALFFIFFITAVSCNKKSFPADSNDSDEKSESAAFSSNGAVVPPAVIIIADEKAKTNKEGELYYDDENGYRYWRSNDGKYYLDKKYSNGTVPKKKTANRKKARKTRNSQEESEYASSR